MNAQNNETEVLINSLKSSVKVRGVEIIKLRNNLKHAEDCMIESWKYCPVDVAEKMAWQYVEKSNQDFWKKSKSELFGVLSYIDEYTIRTGKNKGKTIQAHFSENHKYIDSVKNLGDKPVSYDGNFKITRNRFIFSHTNLYTAMSIEDLFVPLRDDEVVEVIIEKKIEIINLEEDDDDDENIPIAKLIQRIKKEQN